MELFRKIIQELSGYFIIIRHEQTDKHITANQGSDRLYHPCNGYSQYDIHLAAREEKTTKDRNGNGRNPFLTS